MTGHVPTPHPDAHVIDVASDVAEVLLGMGMPATDVISTASAVCRAKASRRVHVDILSTMVMVTQDGSATEAPVSNLRPAPSRALDYGVVQAITDGVRDLEAGYVSLDELEALCQTHLARKRYPWVQLMVSAGLISAGVCFLLGTSLPVLLATFLIGCLGERVLAGFFGIGLPPLVVQAGAAVVITMTSILASSAGVLAGLQLPSEPMIIGGIVMLVVGMKFVAAFQDALDGFYLTAAAGIFRVAMLTTGIVIGILVGLWVLHQARISAFIDTDPPTMGPAAWQVLGAAIIAGAFAWYCHGNLANLVVSTVVGALTWTFFLWVVSTGIHEVAACGLMGILSGILASLSARRWRIPPLAITTAGIVTAVPGLRLYMGLMETVSSPLWSQDFFDGLTTLAIAVGIGLAIAIGASLGVVLGRPLRDRLRMMRARTARLRTGREKSVATVAPHPDAAP